MQNVENNGTVEEDYVVWFVPHCGNQTINVNFIVPIMEFIGKGIVM